MKKLLLSLTVIATLLISCVFMTSAVFTDNYFTLDIPNSYELEQGYCEYTWTNDNGSTIYIYHEADTNNLDFDNLTTIEINALNAKVTSNYEEIDGVTITDDFVGTNVNFCGHMAYRYSGSCEIYGTEYAVVGYLFVAQGRSYTFETVATQDDKYDVAYIASTFSAVIDDDNPIDDSYLEEDHYNEDDNPIDDSYLEEDHHHGNDAPTEEGQIEQEHYHESDGYQHIASDDGQIEFVLAPEFVENVDSAIGAVDRIWVTEDSPKAGFAYGIQTNTSNEDFSDLSDSQLDTVLDYFLEGADGMIDNAGIERYEENGLKGIKIKGDMKFVGVECVVNTYMFTTEDDIIYVYTYEYEDGAGVRVEEIMSSLKIKGLESGTDNYIETIGPVDTDSSDSGVAVLAIVGAVLAGIAVIAFVLIVVIVVVVKGKKKKKNAAMNQAQGPNGYPMYNQYNGSYPNNQGNTGSYPGTPNGAYPNGNQGNRMYNNPYQNNQYNGNNQENNGYNDYRS